MNELKTQFQKHIETFSKCLTERIKKLPVQQFKLACITIGIIAGGFCFHLIFNSSSDKTWIDVPAKQMINPSVANPELMPLEEYRALLEIKNMLDSLKNSREGRMLFDKLMIEHPGFLDSLEFLLSIYQND